MCFPMYMYYALHKDLFTVARDYTDESGDSRGGTLSKKAISAHRHASNIYLY